MHVYSFELGYEMLPPILQAFVHAFAHSMLLNP